MRDEAQRMSALEAILAPVWLVLLFMLRQNFEWQSHDKKTEGGGERRVAIPSWLHCSNHTLSLILPGAPMWIILVEYLF